MTTAASLAHVILYNHVTECVLEGAVSLEEICSLLVKDYSIRLH